MKDTIYLWYVQPDAHVEDVSREGDVVPRLAQKMVGSCRRSAMADFWYAASTIQEIIASHTSYTTMAAQAAAKAPFRAGTKEVFLYVCP